LLHHQRFEPVMGEMYVIFTELCMKVDFLSTLMGNNSCKTHICESNYETSNIYYLILQL